MLGVTALTDLRVALIYDSCLRLLRDGPYKALQRLDCVIFHDSSALLIATLQALPALTELGVHGHIDLPDTRSVLSLPSLTHLNSVPGLPCLRAPKLLSVDCCEHSAEWLCSLLRESPSLQSLSIHINKDSKEWKAEEASKVQQMLQSGRAWPSLTELAIHHPISSQTETWLALLGAAGPSLTSLAWSCESTTRFFATFSRALRVLPKLRSFTVDTGGFEPSKKWLAKATSAHPPGPPLALPELTRLNMEACTGEFLRGFNFSSLTELTLDESVSGISISDVLRQFPLLRKLTLNVFLYGSGKLTTQSLRLPYLETLVIEHRNWMDEHVIRLVRVCPKLRHLSVCSDRITEEFLAELAKLDLPLESLVFEPDSSIEYDGNRAVLMCI